MCGSPALHERGRLPLGGDGGGGGSGPDSSLVAGQVPVKWPLAPMAASALPLGREGSVRRRKENHGYHRRLSSADRGPPKYPQGRRVRVPLCGDVFHVASLGGGDGGA